MFEVEAKARLSRDLARRIASALESMGAELLGTRTEKDIYFEYADPSCGSMASTDRALRLRIIGEECELTYKGPRLGGELKAREEINLRVNECSAAVSLLKHIGFKPFSCVTKKRTMYRLGELKVSIDEVEGLGTFIEIEALSEDRARAEEEVRRLARRLGVKEEFITQSYLELLLEKGIVSECWKDD